MFPRIFLTTITLTALILGGMIMVWAASDLTAKHARDLIRKLGGAELKSDQVRIKTVGGGIGSNAIVVAQIETAVRFKEEDGKWAVADIRLGDRHWESVELVTEAIRREKIRRTEIILQKLEDAIEAYQKERGSYPVGESFEQLLDQLAPRFLPMPVRFDLWEQPLLYRGTASEYKLSSAGPDLKPATTDDLIIENR